MKRTQKEEKREKIKNQIKTNRRILKLEREIKELRQVLPWTSNKAHRMKSKRKSTNKVKKILQQLKNWANKRLNGNEDIIYVREKTQWKRKDTMN